MKRVFALLLAMLLVCGILSGCTNKKDTLRILTIGNTHSVDAMWLLPEIFRKEAPTKNVVLGILYNSGCAISQHAKNITEDADAYGLYIHRGEQWELTKNVTAQQALAQEQWDIVVMQQMNIQAGLENEYIADQWIKVIDMICGSQKSAPKLIYHMPWSNPDDYATYLDDGAKLAHPTATADWRTRHESYFRSPDGRFDHTVQYGSITELTEKHLADTTAFLGKKCFEDVIPSATAVEYALDVLYLPQQEIYRDYTHLNDFGRYIAGYTWYAKLMGLEELTQVNLTQIPAALHHSGSDYPVPEQALTDTQKETAIKCVNWALKNPFSLPQQ